MAVSLSAGFGGGWVDGSAVEGESPVVVLVGGGCEVVAVGGGWGLGVVVVCGFAVLDASGCGAGDSVLAVGGTRSPVADDTGRGVLSSSAASMNTPVPLNASTVTPPAIHHGDLCTGRRGLISPTVHRTDGHLKRYARLKDVAGCTPPRSRASCEAGGVAGHPCLPRKR